MTLCSRKDDQLKKTAQPDKNVCGVLSLCDWFVLRLFSRPYDPWETQRIVLHTVRFVIDDRSRDGLFPMGISLEISSPLIEMLSSRICLNYSIRDFMRQQQDD